MDLLDAPTSSHGVMGDNEVVLVVGPSDKPNLDGILREYARVYMDPVVKAKAQAGWAGGATMLKEGQLLGAPEKSVGDYASALFARALALKAQDANDAQYDAQ